MSMRRVVLTAGSAVLTVVFAAVVSTTWGGRGATTTKSAAGGSQRDVVITAARLGDEEQFKAVVVPSSSLTRPAASARQAQLIPRNVKGLTRVSSAAALSRVQQTIADRLTGKAATRIGVAAANAYRMAVPHAATYAGQPVSVVNVDGGLRDFAVQSVSVDGTRSTVVATCTTYLKTYAYYADGTEQTFAPTQTETDTITLSQDADGTWQVSDISFAFPSGGP